jgi:hypothetical protein
MMKKDILSGNHKILSSLPKMSRVIVYSMLTLLCGCQATYHNSDADIFRIIEKFPQLETSLPQTIREELNK